MEESIERNGRGGRTKGTVEEIWIEGARRLSEEGRLAWLLGRGLQEALQAASSGHGPREDAASIVARLSSWVKVTVSASKACLGGEADGTESDTIHMLFRTFRRVGSATATVKAFRNQGLQFPRRLRKGPRKGELLWAPLVLSRVLQILHNPRYTGAFFYGKRQIRRDVHGVRHSEKLSRENWHALVLDAHEGYITWEEFEENQRRLWENGLAYGIDQRKSPPREGPALLQGLAVCGICGKRMTIRYHTRDGRQIPDYMCQRDGIERGQSPCQHIPGKSLDEAIGELFLKQ